MDSTRKKKILVSGLNPAWQKILTFERFRPGEVNRAATSSAMASGKGINFARAATTWGRCETTLFQFAGGDTGKLLTDSLDMEKISHITAQTDSPTRVCTTLISKADSTTTELIEPSAEIPARTVSQLLDSALEKLPSCDALAICGTYPPGVKQDFYAALAAEAKRQKKFILLDSFMNVEQTLKAGVSLLKINLEELLKLTDRKNPSDALKLCIDKYGLEMIAVTNGSGKALCYDGRNAFMLTPPHIKQVVNPIGAGDTCSAVLLSELLCGTPLADAFQVGLAAASASCLTGYCAFFDKDTAIQLAAVNAEKEIIELK